MFGAFWTRARGEEERVPRAGRAVLITGCDSGFGHALALRLSGLGLQVFAGVLDSEGAGAKKLKEQDPEHITVLQMDVTSPEQIAQVKEAVKKQLGEKGLMCPYSSLTTKELQQNWREEKRQERPRWLLFELPSHRVRETAFSRHVVYELVIMRSGSFDSRRVSVERRYSDFAKLHQTLLHEFQEELDEILLPRKLLTGNFNPEQLLERRVALQDYVAQLYAKRCVRYSEHFASFFTDQEMRKAHGLLRAGQFRPCLELLQLVLEIQEKLAPWQSSTFLVHTLAALAVCHRDLEEPEEAYEAAHRALPAVRRYRLAVAEYHAPLLELLVDLGYSLGRPVGQMQDELMALRNAERGRVDTRSLKEIVVHKFV